MLQSIDFFRKLPKDIDTTTACGGSYSLGAFMLGLFLMVFQISLFTKTRIEKSMQISDNFCENKVSIQLSMTFYNSPCMILSLCSENDMTHQYISQQQNQNLKYLRLDSTGKGIESYTHEQITPPNYFEELQKAITNQEGCLLTGSFEALKVPGNFHVSFHQNNNFYHQLTEVQKNQLKLNYKINYLYFGKQENHELLKKHNETFKNVDLKFAAKFDLEFKSDDLQSYYNFLKIISNRLIDNKQKIDFSLYQFSMNSRSDKFKNMRETPSVMFKYEFSPIQIEYQVKYNNIFKVIVKVFAIVGGIFALIGILNSLTQNSVKIIQKKK